jgi:hypothetical protein
MASAIIAPSRNHIAWFHVIACTVLPRQALDGGADFPVGEVSMPARDTAAHLRPLQLAAKPPAMEVGIQLLILLLPLDGFAQRVLPWGSVNGARFVPENQPSGPEAARRITSSLLPAETELGDDRPVSLDVVFGDIVEHSATSTNKHQETSPTVMVLLVGLQMIGEVVDAIGQQRNLDLRRACIAVVKGVIADRVGLRRKVRGHQWCFLVRCI